MNSASDWTVCFDQPVASFAASRPSQPDRPIPGAKHIKLTPEGTYGSAYLRLITRDGGGHQFWVPPGTFGNLKAETKVSFQSASAWLYHLYRITHDSSQALAVFGSTLAIVALLVTDVIPPSPALTKYVLAAVGIAGVIVTLVGLLIQADKSAS